MNFQKLLFLLLFAIVFTACEKDEIITCTPSDWIGTYTGTVVCGAVMNDATITITASGSTAIIVKYEESTGSTEYDPIVPTDCDLIKDDSDPTFSLSIDGILDGDDLTITETWSTLGQTATCIISGVRN